MQFFWIVVTNSRRMGIGTEETKGGWGEGKPKGSWETEKAGMMPIHIFIYYMWFHNDTVNSWRCRVKGTMFAKIHNWQNSGYQDLLRSGDLSCCSDRLDSQGIRIPSWSRRFFLLSNFQTGSGAHSVSYPVGTGGAFSGGKAQRPWINTHFRLLLMLIEYGAISSLPYTSSWWGAWGHVVV
jgi:hypothetical protein